MLKQAAYFLAFLILLTVAFVGFERAFSPIFQICVTQNQNTDANKTAKENPTALSTAIQTYVRCTGEFVDAHSPAITAVATIIIAAFTGTLWVATSRQAQLTGEALIADKRAFVFRSEE